MNFLFFFHQYTAHSSRAEDGLQMYWGGSVVNKFSIIDPQISSDPRLIFTASQGVKECEVYGIVFNVTRR